MTTWVTFRGLLLGLLLGLGVALAASVTPVPLPGGAGPAFAQSSPGPVEPTAPRVGHVRRNAQGVIELVPPPAPPPVAAPAAAPAARPAAEPPPRASPPARAAAPAGLPSAPAPLASPAPATTPAPASPAPAPQAAATAIPQERACPDSVLLCLTVLGGEGGAQDSVPVTFGHPLAPKLLQPGQRLVGRFNGATLPVQLDQVATHYDGSVRFAVFSLVLPRIADRGPHKLELVADATAPLPAPPPIAALPGDVRIEIETYSSQVYEVLFGDRKGHTPGTPFKLGEIVTLVVGEGATQERFSVPITDKLAGGGFETLTEIAKGFVRAMAKSDNYLGHQKWMGAYERLWVTARRGPGTRFPIKFEYNGAAKISAEVVQPWEGRALHVATLADGTSKSETWLDGATVRETFRTATLRPAAGGREHPLLLATLAARQYAGSPAIRYEFVLENSFALPGGIRNLEYDVALVVGGKRLFEAKAVPHHAYARWHRYAWGGGATAATVIHDRGRLFDSRALSSYDPSLRISEAAIAGTLQAYGKSDLGPLGNALITTYMPMTGGRPDIAPLPSWSAMHVVSQDPRLLPIVLGNGDASGAVPVHYRDRSTGKAMNVAWFPEVRIHDGLVVNGRIVQQGFDATPFIPDTAHQPSLTYYPYLLTGDQFYLEELHFWASWNALVRRVDMRDQGTGILREDQLRGQAWTLRTLGHAALVTPDRHPMKQVFQKQLSANLAWYNKTYATDQPAQPGKFPRWLVQWEPETITAPWQHDFMILTLGSLVENEVPGAKQLLLWTTRFALGRFLAEGQGYCRASAPHYWLKVRERPDDPPPETWAQVHRLNWPDVRTCAGVPWIDGVPHCTVCYTSVAAAALATMVNVGIEAAQEPYTYIRTQTGNRSANYASDPGFAIVPRRLKP